MHHSVRGLFVSKDTLQLHPVWIPFNKYVHNFLHIDGWIVVSVDERQLLYVNLDSAMVDLMKLLSRRMTLGLLSHSHEVMGRVQAILQQDEYIREVDGITCSDGLGAGIYQASLYRARSCTYVTTSSPPAPPALVMASRHGTSPSAPAAGNDPVLSGILPMVLARQIGSTSLTVLKRK